MYYGEHKLTREGEEKIVFVCSKKNLKSSFFLPFPEYFKSYRRYFHTKASHGNFKIAHQDLGPSRRDRVGIFWEIRIWFWVSARPETQKRMPFYLPFHFRVFFP